MPFKCDPGRYREQFERDGYVLVKDILSDRLLSHLRNFDHKACAGEVSELPQGRVTGKKQQYVFDFPDHGMALRFRAGLARLTGMPEDAIAISERHLKQYDTAADPWPAPHKDRKASAVSVGLPVRLAEGSTVAVFPHLDRTPNPEEKALFLQGGKAFYEFGEPKYLNEAVGDMIVFLGSTIFHERVRAAGTSVLYIKLNAAGDDPLGEDIFLADAATPQPATEAA